MIIIIIIVYLNKRRKDYHSVTCYATGQKVYARVDARAILMVAIRETKRKSSSYVRIHTKRCLVHASAYKSPAWTAPNDIIYLT